MEGHYNVRRTGIYLYKMPHITKTSPPTTLTLSKSLNCYSLASHLLRGRHLDITNRGYTLPPLTEVEFLKTVNHEGSMRAIFICGERYWQAFWSEFKTATHAI